MARNLGDAFVRVRPDTDGFRSEAEGRLSGALKKAAAVAAIAGAAGLAKFTQASIGSASQVQQSFGAVESVFGRVGDRVKRFSKDAAGNVGLASSQYAQLAAVFGSQLRNMGVAQKELFPTTDRLIGLGADLSAMFGGTAAEAVESISSLLRGERDPIERYGVSIKQATIDAYLAAKGLGNLEGAAKRQAETQATLAILFQQTGKAQGQFARESNTFAGVQQRLGAQWENLKAVVGAGVLPVLTSLGTVFTTQVMPALIPLAEKWVPKLSAGLSGMFTGFDPSVVFARIGDAVRGVDWAGIGASISTLSTSGKQLGPAFKEASTALPSLTDLLDVTGVVLQFAADHVDLLAKALPYLAAGFVVVKLAQLGANAAAAASPAIRVAEVIATRQQTRAILQQTAALGSATGAQVTNGVVTGVATKMTIRQRVATIATTVAQKAAAVATRVFAVATRVLNAAMRANPIGLVITALALLAAGLVYAYRKSDTFRRIVDKAFSVVKNVAKAAVDFIVDKVPAGFRKVVDFIASVPGRIKALGGRFLDAGRALIGAFVDGLKNAGGVISGIAGNVWNAVKGLLNGAIGKINAALEFTIPLPGPNLTINPPNIPMLAGGGRVTRPTLAMIGEGREPETVLPDSMLRGLLNRRGPDSGVGLPETVVLRVGDREFTAYVDERADARVDRRDRRESLARRGGRQAP